MKAMKISLVIANYNNVEFLDRAIRSCVGQLLFRVPYEILVIDDASTDGSADVISEFDSDLVCIFNEQNLGVAACSNLALAASTGQYWMRVDADDFLNQYACAYMSEILDHNPDIGFVYCDHYRVDVRGVKVERIRLDDDEVLWEHGAGIMFRAEVLREIGGYDEQLRSCEDYDLLLRLRAAGVKGYYLPVPLYRYYIHGMNMTLRSDRDTLRELVRSKHGLPN